MVPNVEIGNYLCTHSGPQHRADVLGLGKQWKELAEQAVAIERHRCSGLIRKPIEE
jgi:hypothetical protein